MLSTKKDVPKKSTTTSSKPSNARLTTKEADKERKKIKKEETNTTVNRTLKPALKTNIRESPKVSNGVTKTIPKIKQSISSTSIASPSSSRTRIINNNINTKSSIKTTTKKAPTTPPSNRVIKTQFYPSKEMYANALKTQKADVKIKLNVKTSVKGQPETKRSSVKNQSETKHKIDRKDSIRERNKTRVLKPNEIKLVKKESSSSPDTSTITERPGTATLTKGKIVNAENFASTVEDEYTYEDDFDSYESDFEAYTSSQTSISSSTKSSSSTDGADYKQEIKESLSVTIKTKQNLLEDERKLDSGNFDLPENKHKQILNNIKETIESSHNRSSLTSLSDEGFEDAKALSMQFINFADAQKQCQREKISEKRRKRGEEILSMIQLDSYSFTLFELSPIPYEKFIKLYGQSNMMQASSQTRDDDVTEDTQTEVIEIFNKWNQFPIKFTKIKEEDSDYLVKYKREILGVGGDETIENVPSESYEENNRLNNFLLHAGKVMLCLLEESATLSADMIKKSLNIPFSEGYTDFDINCDEIIKDRKVTFVSFATNINTKILTIHNNENGSTVNDDAKSLRSVICVWSLSNPSCPEHFLITFGKICCCCFDYSDTSLIFGGMQDGTICVWNLNESAILHASVPENYENSVTYRTPTYTTEINSAHSTNIVSIESIIDPLDNTSSELGLIKWKVSNNLCTLDEDGEIFVWDISINKHNSNKLNDKLGLAHWGSVIITQNSMISTQKMFPELKNLKCTSMSINKLDPNHIFISTNYGYILHCLVKGTNVIRKKYTSETKSQVDCLSSCPFSPLYFLAGCSSGNISLYSRLTEKPLMVMSNKEGSFDESKIEFLQWSFSRPCMFYTKDSNNIIHIWNLAESDIYPMYSIPFKEQILYMKLSPTYISETTVRKCFMMIATSKSLHLHILNDEHGQQTYEKYQQDVKKFLNYVNIL